MLKEIAEFVESKTSFTLGTTLWFGTRKSTAPNRCVLVAFNGASAVYFDIPERTDQMVQVIARADSYVQAYNDALEVHNALHGTAGWALPVIVSGTSYFAQTIEAVNAPQYIGPDEKGRHEFSVNFIFRILKQS